MVIWVLVCGKVQGSSEGNRARLEFLTVPFLRSVVLSSLLTLPTLSTAGQRSSSASPVPDGDSRVHHGKARPGQSGELIKTEVNRTALVSGLLLPLSHSG